MWINMKKNYPGNNTPLIGLEHCSYLADRDYDLPDATAKKLIKTGFAKATTAPWERGTNPELLEYNRRLKAIEKICDTISQKKQALQNVLEIAQTIPQHKKNIEALDAQLMDAVTGLREYAAKNKLDPSGIPQVEKKTAEAKAKAKKAAAGAKNEKSETAAKSASGKSKDAANSAGQAAETEKK